ncbi:10124_t:CDS:1, partial [Paraglomus occultum]
SHTCFEFGKRVERNYRTAAEYYQKAAAQGHLMAQYTLASRQSMNNHQHERTRILLPHRPTRSLT